MGEGLDLAHEAEAEDADAESGRSFSHGGSSPYFILPITLKFRYATGP